MYGIRANKLIQEHLYVVLFYFTSHESDLRRYLHHSCKVARVSVHERIRENHEALIVKMAAALLLLFRKRQSNKCASRFNLLAYTHFSRKSVRL